MSFLISKILSLYYTSDNRKSLYYQVWENSKFRPIMVPILFVCSGIVVLILRWSLSFCNNSTCLLISSQKPFVVLTVIKL